MTRVLRFVLAVLTAGFISAPVWAAAPVQRFTLIVGANSGGPDRAALQYAVLDAERFARVMTELGGVNPADEILLKQPTLRDLVDALDLLANRVAAARRATRPPAGRIEVILYYSGHADEQGLLLGSDRYSYRTLRDRLDRIDADVRIAVLDACASGAFTRLKGGRARPAFLVDESAAMRGHAFLTSSAETEAAQESDRIRASYFTHFLVSGFRGAADLSGDGKVTLSEAYQFAFSETLGKTVDTRGGAQHPSYDINLSGTGDVVITDVRQTTATLVLPADLEGRFFIRNAAHEMVVELYKPHGRQVELGLEPGAYDVRLDLQKTLVSAKVQIADGGRMLLEARQFGPAALETTRRRGDAEHTPFAVAGRNRLELRWGRWGTSRSGIPLTDVEIADLFGGVRFTHYFGETRAMTFSVSGFGDTSGVMVSPESVFSATGSIVAVTAGFRQNPFRGRHGSIKPYLEGSVGPIFGATSRSLAFRGTVSSSSSTQAAIGGHAGAGVDFHVARSVSLGIEGGYNWMADFPQPAGPKSNYSGPDFGVSIGWLFGRARVQ
jgi:Caspase domain